MNYGMTALEWAGLCIGGGVLIGVFLFGCAMLGCWALRTEDDWDHRHE